MPWKETSVMDERMKFIGRLLSGDKITGATPIFLATHDSDS